MTFVRGLERPEVPFFIKATEGLDSLRKDFDIGQKSDIAQNLRFAPEVGSVTKRAPVSYYNSVVEDNLISSCYRYYRTDTNQPYMIQLNGTKLRGSTDGTFYDLATLSGSYGKRFTAVTYKDLAFISTGYDDVIVTDGEKAWQLGACKAELEVDSTINQITAGAHYYAVVFENTDASGVTTYVVNGALSNTVTNDATHTKTMLTNIPQGGESCTARWIYRTAAGGSTLRLIGIIADNDTLEWEDKYPDSSFIVGTVFTGAGLNDATVAGPYTGYSDATFRIEVQVANMYTFTCNTISNLPSPGNTYTNNGQTFTVLSCTTNELKASGTGDPNVSGNLVRTSGSGSNPIVFTSWIKRDAFRWRKDSGTYTNYVSMTGLSQTLQDGMTVTFGATTGHTVGNYWTTTVVHGLGTDMGAVTDDVPRGLYLYVDQERLFIAGEPSRRSYIYYSDQYAPGYIPTGSSNLSNEGPASNYEAISPDDGDIITGVVNVLGITFVFKQNSIRNWFVAGTPDTWVLSGVISKVGCPAPYTIANAPEGVYYQGWEHMYLFDGQYSRPVIDDFLFDENFLDSRRSENVGHYWNNMYLLAYTDANAGHSYHDRVLVFDWLRKQSSIDKGGSLVSGGIMNVNCFTSLRGSGEWGQLYAGDSQLGWIYQYDRTISMNQLNTKTGINTGIHGAGSMATGTEDNPILSAIKLDDMSTYTTDALAREAWVTSVSTKVPSTLGTGTDGAKTVNSDETLAARTYNYLTLTIDAGKTLTVGNGAVIRVMGTVQINGTLKCEEGQRATLYAYTVNLAGTLNGNVTIKANTINNTGTITGVFLGRVAQASIPQVSTSGTTASDTRTSTTNFSSTTVTKLIYNLSAHGSTYLGSSSASAEVSIYQNGAWVVLYTSSCSNCTASLNATSTGTWSNVSGIKAYISAYASSSRDILIFGGITTLEAYGMPSFYYVNGTGTLPDSGDTSDFVNAIDVWSESGTVSEGTYSIKVVAAPGAATLNGNIVRTIDALDLSAYDTYYIDIWCSRATTLRFGMGNAAYTDNTEDITVTTPSTFITYTLDFTGATKNAITKLGLQFLNTDVGTIVYMDNIRPAIASTTYTSSSFEINAQTLDKIYWNEQLTAYGTINVYTRTSDTPIYGLVQSVANNAGNARITSTAHGLVNGDSVIITGTTSYNGTWVVSGVTTDTFDIADPYVASETGNWEKVVAWSAALTNPSGSTIASTARKYFQFRVDMSTTNTLYFPYIYKTTGFNIKFTYWKVRSVAESVVEFIYRSGWRNLEAPFHDKIFRKLISYHEGADGYFDCTVETGRQDTQDYTFSSVSLDDNPTRWYTTLADNMYGKEVRIQFYKNDAYDFKLRQYAMMVEAIPLI